MSKFNSAVVDKLGNALVTLSKAAGSDPESIKAVDVINQGLAAMSDALTRFRQIEAQIEIAANEFENRLQRMTTIKKG